MRSLLLVVHFFIGCSPSAPGPSPPPPDRATQVEFSTSLGKEKGRGLLVVPDGEGPFPPLVLLHGDSGLTEQMQQNAKRLAKKGYLVLAVDLYRGEIAHDVEEAHIIGSRLTEERVAADLKGAVDLLLQHPDLKPGPVAIIGWELGGGYALDAAIRDPRIGAVVTCYGRLTTDPALLKPMKASVLGIFAGKDEGISPETIETFKKAMKQAGRKVAGLHVFKDCDNGFMNPPAASKPSRTEIDGMDRAWVLIEEYLAAELLRQPQR